MNFHKYQVIGNDYLILDARKYPTPTTLKEIKFIYNRNFGLGSDGILFGSLRQFRSPHF